MPCGLCCLGRLCTRALGSSVQITLPLLGRLCTWFLSSCGCLGGRKSGLSLKQLPRPDHRSPLQVSGHSREIKNLGTPKTHGRCFIPHLFLTHPPHLLFLFPSSTRHLQSEQTLLCSVLLIYCFRWFRGSRNRIFPPHQERC